MKRLVFPSPYPPDDDNYEAHQNRLVQSLSSVSKKKDISPMVTSTKGGQRNSGGGGEGKNMDVIDAPDNTLRARLIAKMTSLDTNIKRCVSEFIFFLCNENSKPLVSCCLSFVNIGFLSSISLFLFPFVVSLAYRCILIEDEFVYRTGFGNSVALLQSKGFF
jgi:hypothetical protein